MKYIILLAVLGLSFGQCKPIDKPSVAGPTLLLDSAQRHSSDHALDGLVAMDGLEVTLFASEPMLQNPTNIDIDQRGRVYVCEAYNYRPQISGIPTKFEGDRIMILEDKDGDGVADESKVFYQGPEINAPLGICVLGRQVIVSQSPYVWLFTDTDGDDKADKKEILFQGIGGIQHDHAVHAFTLGPDGRFYFAMGNEASTLYDKNNRIISTISGQPIDKAHFKQGLTIRGNLDGTGMEVIGQNFRNNYECTVDAYGNVWQTDNDDDGNKGTRFNFILEYGKYGYRDELTDAGWRTFRTNWEDSIPLRHWHQNDPGVIPNLLNLGSGSPCGVVIYESDLIPQLKGTVLHAEALHHVIRSYQTKVSGAGYTADIKEVLKHETDDWFRPVDICVAPDGSLLVADWYDPGVGGHYAGDQVKGRIYRIAPKGQKYKFDDIDFSNVEASVKALASPNLSIRSQAQLSLRKIVASESLKALAHHTDPILKARALWILSAENGSYIDTAFNDQNEQIKIAGLRMARQQGAPYLINSLDQLLTQNLSSAVWRECAISLANLDEKTMVPYWLQLADKYSATDRWYLEALGIAGDQHWQSIIPQWLKRHPDPLSQVTTKDILWRSRASFSLPFMASIVSSQEQPLNEKMKFLRTMEFVTSPDKNKTLIDILTKTKDTTIAELIVKSLDPVFVNKDKRTMQILNQWLDKSQGSNYLDLVDRFNPGNQGTRLSQLVTGDDNSLRVRACKAIIKSQGFSHIEKLYFPADTVTKKRIIQAVGPIGTEQSLKFLHEIALNKNESMVIHQEAYRQLGKSGGGEEYVIKLLTQGMIPKEYIPFAVEGPANAWRKPIKEKAKEYLAQSQVDLPVYNTANIIAQSGNVENGKAVFQKTCSTCHQVHNEGVAFGPGLDEIGSKYGKDGILTSILEPSKAINFGYEGEQIITTNGGIYVGLKISETNEAIVLKSVGGQQESIDKKEIKERIAIRQSLMTPNLYQNMSEQELVDLVEYLASLKKVM